MIVVVVVVVVVMVVVVVVVVAVVVGAVVGMVVVVVVVVVLVPVVVVLAWLYKSSQRWQLHWERRGAVGGGGKRRCVLALVRLRQHKWFRICTQFARSGHSVVLKFRGCGHPMPLEGPLKAVRSMESVLGGGGVRPGGPVR